MKLKNDIVFKRGDSVLVHTLSEEQNKIIYNKFVECGAIPFNDDYSDWYAYSYLVWDGDNDLHYTNYTEYLFNEYLEEGKTYISDELFDYD